MNRDEIIGSAVVALLIGVLLVGCAGGVGAPSMAQAEVPRATAQDVPEGDVATLVDGNSAFAFDLYQALRGEEGNLFYSPHSVSVALAMTYAGARGITEEQMADVLNYTLPQDRLHPAINALDLELASRGAGAEGQDDKGFRLKIANSVWGQTGYQFLAEYLETLASNYGAGLRLVDFQQAPDPSRIQINDWVEEQTEGKIVDLLPEGSVDELTRLVLANAVYFNAAWKYPFAADSTHPGSFTLLDGSQVSVPMMSEMMSVPYAKGAGYQAIELPYDGDELSMVILLPDTGTFDEFEAALTGEQVGSMLKELRPQQVSLTLPKFTYESSFGLGDTLKEMGMTEAMDPDKADFSGMTDKRDLYISDVVHKAIVAVDEEGTEAAAATGVTMRTTAAPVVDVTLTVDHPFVFLIRDLQTGAIVFVGRVLNPAA